MVIIIVINDYVSGKESSRNHFGLCMGFLLGVLSRIIMWAYKSVTFICHLSKYFIILFLKEPNVSAFLTLSGREFHSFGPLKSIVNCLIFVLQAWGRY